METDSVQVETLTPLEDQNMDIDNSQSSTIPVQQKAQSSGRTSFSGKSGVKDFSLDSTSLIPKFTQEDLKKVFLNALSSPLTKEQTENKEPMSSSKMDESEKKDEDLEIVEKTYTVSFASVVKSTAPILSSSTFVIAAISESQKSRTENNAPTFSTSDDPSLDFFFGIMEQSDKYKTLELLKKSWSVAPLDSLKLLANLRDIREGKGIRLQYQECLYWMYQNHPKTLYENMAELATFGYWKDLLHFLIIILFDGYIHPFFEEDANPIPKKKQTLKPTKVQINKYRKRLQRSELEIKVNDDDDVSKVDEDGFATVSKKVRKLKNSGPYDRKKNPKKFALFQESNIQDAQADRQKKELHKRLYDQRIAKHYKLAKAVSELPRNEMTALRLKYAREKFSKDLKYRLFHTKIAQIFASQLIKDLIELNKKTDEGIKKEISLAGKWAPSLEAHCDKYSLISSAIGLEIVHQTGGNHLEILTKRIPVATYLARKLYHKDYCVPLRKYHDVPERHMSANKWDKVKYDRVAAKCMKKNKRHFFKHDEERFTAYFKDTKSKVAGASLKPVEIIYEAMELDIISEDDKEQVMKKQIIEKQWITLAESVKAKGGGLLKNAVAICDVSGSMTGVPMQAAIGLTLLTMGVSEEPWNSICITFSEHPQIFNLDTSLGLVEKLRAIKAMQWGMNTDLQKVFELIVSLGKKNNLIQEQMPKILFIFTDMEFDQACSGSNQTNFEAAKSLFTREGYLMPTIIFWNLRDSSTKFGGKSTPVQKNELGVALLSGFSGMMLSYVMENEDLSNMTSMNLMTDILNDEKYNKLAVFD